MTQIRAKCLKLFQLKMVEGAVVSALALRAAITAPSTISSFNLIQNRTKLRQNGMQKDINWTKLDFWLHVLTRITTIFTFLAVKNKTKIGTKLDETNWDNLDKYETIWD